MKRVKQSSTKEAKNSMLRYSRRDVRLPGGDHGHDKPRRGKPPGVKIKHLEGK